MSAGARTRMRAQQQMSGSGGASRPLAKQSTGSPLARQNLVRSRPQVAQQSNVQRPTQMPLEDVLKTFWNRILENNDEQMKYITDLSQRVADLEESDKDKNKETSSVSVASNEIQSQINDLNLKYTQLNNLLIEVQTAQLTINNQLLNKFNANADGLVNAVSQSDEVQVEAVDVVEAVGEVEAVDVVEAVGEVEAVDVVEAEQEAVSEEAAVSNTNDIESEVVVTPENVLEATATDEKPNEEPNEEENVTLNIGNN